MTTRQPKTAQDLALEARAPMHASGFAPGGGNGVSGLLIASLGGARDRWTSAACLLLAAFAAGQAVQAYNGALSPEAFVWLNLAVAAGLLAVLLPAVPWLERNGRAVVSALGGAVLLQQFSNLLSQPLAVYAVPPAGRELFAPQMLGCSAVLAGLAVAGRPRLGRWFVPLLIVPHALLGFWILSASPTPHIDVFYFQRDSSAALLAHQNPYTLTFPNIYGDASAFYGPNMSLMGRLQFGYPYPPASLLFSVVGHWFGDFRYAQLAAMEGAALCMIYARGGPAGALAAAVFLFTPRAFFVLEQGWTEPYLVFLLAATVFTACRCPRALPFVLGAFLAVKQYLVLAAVPALLVVPRGTGTRGWIRFIALTSGTLLVLTLPLALWNWKAFYRDVIALQVYQPFRPDALSYLAWWYSKRGQAPSAALAFALAAVATVLSMLRFARSPAGFASAVSLVMMAFFAFNKQAFCNYYFFVIGALCTSVAATRT